MQVESYRKLYRRELEKLKNEIELYKDGDALWIVDKAISNSAGHLCLHLIGNLNHFIGAGLGNVDYARDRDLEFMSDEVPRETLIDGINATTAIVDIALKTITCERLRNEYPMSKFAEQTSLEFALVHLLAHLTYHVGQMNYHRRLFDN